MSDIERTVCAKIKFRAEAGLRIYGAGMDRQDFTRLQWLNHAQEEAMDLAIYLERLIQDEIAQLETSRKIAGEKEGK